MSSRRSEMSTSFFLTIKLNELIMVSGHRLGQIVDLASNSELLVLEGWNLMRKYKVAGQKPLVVNY